MEPVLRELVQREGFEAVFTALKEIVMSEYERANRDYQFFLKVTGEDKKAVHADSEETSNAIEAPVQADSVAVPADSKTVEIVGSTPTVTKKIFRKKSKV